MANTKNSRSNKTAHVLNLLTEPGEASKEPARTPAAAPAPAPTPDNYEEVASAIRDALEEDLQSELSEEAPVPAEPEAAPLRERVSSGQQKARFTDDELAILAATARKALSADEVVEQTQIPMKRALSALTMLQVQGAVEERPGRRFYALVELEP